MDNDLSYVAIDLTDESKQMLFDLISQIIQDGQEKITLAKF